MRVMELLHTNNIYLRVNGRGFNNTPDFVNFFNKMLLIDLAKIFQRKNFSIYGICIVITHFTVISCFNVARRQVNKG